jgi:hypothetical protein
MAGPSNACRRQQQMERHDRVRLRSGMPGYERPAGTAWRWHWPLQSGRTPRHDLGPPGHRCGIAGPSRISQVDPPQISSRAPKRQDAPSRTRDRLFSRLRRRILRPLPTTVLSKERKRFFPQRCPIKENAHSVQSGELPLKSSTFRSAGSINRSATFANSSPGDS